MEKESSRTPASGPGRPQSKNADAHALPHDGLALARTAAKILTAVAVGVGGVLSLNRRRTRATKDTPAPHTPAEPSDLTPTPNIATETAPHQSPKQRYDHDTVALRAYYLSEERRAAGFPDDPRRDWLDAERELRDDTSATRAK